MLISFEFSHSYGYSLLNCRGYYVFTLSPSSSTITYKHNLTSLRYDEKGAKWDKGFPLMATNYPSAAKTTVYGLALGANVGNFHSDLINLCHNGLSVRRARARNLTALDRQQKPFFTFVSVRKDPSARNRFLHYGWFGGRFRLHQSFLPWPLLPM